MIARESFIIDFITILPATYYSHCVNEDGNVLLGKGTKEGW